MLRHACAKSFIIVISFNLLTYTFHEYEGIADRLTLHETFPEKLNKYTKFETIGWFTAIDNNFCINRWFYITVFVDNGGGFNLEILNGKSNEKRQQTI